MKPLVRFLWAQGEGWSVLALAAGGFLAAALQHVWKGPPGAQLSLQLLGSCLSFVFSFSARALSVCKCYRRDSAGNAGLPGAERGRVCFSNN